MPKAFKAEMELQVARWNHNFTLISIIHAAFLGAFLSKIDYRNSLWTMLIVLVASLVLTGTLYEIHGLGLTRIRKAVIKKFGMTERSLFTTLFLPVAPMAAFFASERSESSLLYAGLAGVIVFSWFVASMTVSGFIASEMRASAKD